MLEKSVFNKIDRGLKTDKMNRSNLKSMAKRSKGQFVALLLKQQDHETALYNLFTVCAFADGFKFFLCYRRIIFLVVSTYDTITIIFLVVSTYDKITTTSKIRP